VLKFVKRVIFVDSALVCAVKTEEDSSSFPRKGKKASVRKTEVKKEGRE
jgi:hypothetical protein